MKAVIDEGVPRRLSVLLRSLGADVAAFPESWKGFTDGTLLDTIESSEFDCLLTCDQNMRHQQNLAGYRLALIILPAQNYENLRPFADDMLAALASIAPGSVTLIRR